MEIICNHCGSKEYQLYIKPFTNKIMESKAHVGAWCKKCQKWIKWVNQRELDLTKIPEYKEHERIFWENSLPQKSYFGRMTVVSSGRREICVCNIGKDHDA